MASPDTEEILPLTGLRFIAALYVFVFHIQLRWPLAPESAFLTNLLGQGAIGMSLFFILSGFVLAKRYHSGKDSFKDYIVNRFARIYPVYAVVAVLTLPWLGVDFQAESAYGSLRHVVTAAMLVLAEALVIQAWFPQMFPMWNNGGSWSISVEVFCYLLLPFILAKVVMLGDSALRRLALAAYGLALLPGMALLLLGGDRLAFYCLPIYRLPEFVMGICTLEILRRRLLPPRLALLLHIPALALLVIYLGLAGNKLPGWITHNWLVLPTIALTIYAVTQGGLLARLLSTRLLVWCGHISYSFYSFQILLLLLLKSHHAALVAWMPLLRDNRMLLLAAFAALMAMSAFGYHCIEEPCRKWIRRRGKAPAGLAPTAAAIS